MDFINVLHLYASYKFISPQCAISSSSKFLSAGSEPEQPRAEAGQDAQEDGESRSPLLTNFIEAKNFSTKPFRIFCIKFSMYRIRQCSKFW